MSEKSKVIIESKKIVSKDGAALEVREVILTPYGQKMIRGANKNHAAPPNEKREAVS